MRRPMSHNRRFRILRRDGHACVYCGRRAPNVVLHVDHVVPLAKGGSEDDENLAASCQTCNLGKGVDLPGDDVVALVRERTAQMPKGKAPRPSRPHMQFKRPRSNVATNGPCGHAMPVWKDLTEEEADRIALAWSNGHRIERSPDWIVYSGEYAQRHMSWMWNIFPTHTCPKCDDIFVSAGLCKECLVGVEALEIPSHHDAPHPPKGVDDLGVLVHN